MVLPDPKNNWAHSTCSKKSLNDALDNPKISAIEADIVMGKFSEGGVCEDYLQPIMAHPPIVTSDLPTKTFLKMTINDRIEAKQMLKHLKLDFKDVETIEPVLNSLDTILETSGFGGDKAIFLNADILPGPGGRIGPMKINSEQFLHSCVTFLDKGKHNKSSCAFSLGWRVDCRSLYGYTQSDVDDMKKVILENKLLECSRGVVLAVNARVLNRNLSSFDSILKEIPQIQLLVWTACGEPPISRSQIKSIEKHFESIGCGCQLGFDCQIASSFLFGVLFDLVIKALVLPWNLKRYLSLKISA